MKRVAYTKFGAPSLWSMFKKACRQAPRYKAARWTRVWERGAMIHGKAYEVLEDA